MSGLNKQLQEAISYGRQQGLQEAHQYNSYGQLDEAKIPWWLRRIPGWAGRGLTRLSPYLLPLEFLPGGIVYDSADNIADDLTDDEFTGPSGQPIDHRKMTPRQLTTHNQRIFGMNPGNKF